MGWTLRILITMTLLFLTQGVWGQTLVDEAKTPLSSGEVTEGTFPETIKIISASKKIFILTNNNQLLNKGDFVSLALDDKLAARAIVAKNHEGQVGIKIIRIYSLTQWARMRIGQEVQVIRGDDSMFGKKVVEQKATEAPKPKIESEEDLYNDQVTLDDGEFDDKSKRHIKPDNVVGVGFGFFAARDMENQTERATQLSAGWAYQFADNWFAEFFYARAQLTAFPNNSDKRSEALVNNVVGRLKYNFKAPLYSFIMPYIGFQSQTVSSNAGETGVAATDAAELEAVDELKKTSPVFGVTLLRRLVPGWFIKADLGTDVLNVGAAIEF
jgi:hypothetical protein